MYRSFLANAMAAAALLIGATNAVAQTYYDWTNPAGGAYGTAGNWSPSGPPTAAGVMRLALPGTYTINYSANAAAGMFVMSQGNATLALGGNTFQLANTTNNGMSGAGLVSTLRILNGSFQPGNFIVGANSGSNSTLLLDAGSTTTVGAGGLQVGQNGEGTLKIQAGGVLNTSATNILGSSATGVGSAYVSGVGSAWNVNGMLRVGSSGVGTLHVGNSGLVAVGGLEVGELAGSVGTLTVSGPGASFIATSTANIGGTFEASPATAATLNVGSGGSLALNGTTNLRSAAVVNVTGGTLKLNVLNASPGAAFNWSAGTVQFANGSALNAGKWDLLLGGTHTLGLNRTLAVAAGTLTLDTNLIADGGAIVAPNIELAAGLTIRQFGSVKANESLTITPGKTVQVDNFGLLAAGSAAFNNGGTLKLNGPQAEVQGVFINESGVVQGTGRFTTGMNNGTGGIVRAETGDHLIIDGFGMSNPGVIELKGGTVEYATTLSNLADGVITGRGVFRGGTSNPGGWGVSNIGVMAFSGGATDIHGDVSNSGAGKIVAAGGSVVTFFDDVVHNGAEIRTNAGSRTVFFGSASGAGPFTGAGVVEFNGDLRPGNSPANVTMGGAVEFGVAAAYHVELGGVVKGAGYDSLTIAGAAALAGSLEAEFINGFQPTWGDTFEILTAGGGITGMFSDVTLPALPGLLFWAVDQDADSIALRVDAPSLPGDFDHNGIVEGADLAQWKGDAGVNGESDGDGDGDSDGADFLVWQRHLGESIFAAPSAIATPEPATCWGAALGAACGLLGGRRRLG